jgi:wyosine [tRNA(Phe)-imidazoG37] synthetase (radical SAM superfamily)
LESKARFFYRRFIMSYTYLFGPVPSRRLGLSLGVDIVPAKVCNLNCVYCECGRTTTLAAERKEWAPVAAILSELSDFLAASPQLDAITITGSGEPTLNTGLKDIASFLTKNFPRYTRALLTNGTLLTIPEVRYAACLFDVVLPSLDAVSNEVFSKVNRPHRSLDNAAIIAGIAQFAREYKGKLWLEVFIVPGVNDSEKEISLLRDVIASISPSRVQLNTLDRPGASSYIRPATSKELLRVAEALRPAAVEIVSRAYSAPAASVSSETFESIILATLRRRPCTVEDLAVTTGRAINDVTAALSLLLERHAVDMSAVGANSFYTII